MGCVLNFIRFKIASHRSRVPLTDLMFVLLDHHVNVCQCLRLGGSSLSSQAQTTTTQQRLPQSPNGCQVFPGLHVLTRSHEHQGFATGRRRPAGWADFEKIGSWCSQGSKVMSANVLGLPTPDRPPTKLTHLIHLTLSEIHKESPQPDRQSRARLLSLSPLKGRPCTPYIPSAMYGSDQTR